MTKQLLTFRRILAVSVTAGFLLASTVAGPALAQDVPPSGFPSWSDVEKAKGDAAATAVQVAKISQLLDSLEAEAGTLGEAAVKAGGDFATTQAKLDAATAEVGVLNAQSKRAAQEAEHYKEAAVAIAVQSYKSGGTGLDLFSALSALESPQSLNGVEMLHQVGERAAVKQALALQSKATAESLEKTRQAAVAAQAELTGQAQAARTAAVDAQTTVTARLDAQKAQSDTLVEQLASLNNTSVATEQEYRRGQNAVAAYEQVQEAKRQAAAVEAGRQAAEAAQRAADEAAKPQPAVPAPNPVVPNPAPIPAPVPAPAPVQPAPSTPAPTTPAAPSPGGSVDPGVPGGAVNDPAGAKGYASARLGAYGWGQGEFQCLNLLWERESNWRTNATNPYSGAYGIAQALPASKYAQTGADWLTNYRTQVDWGLGYIKGRYGSPCGAWAHSEAIGWY
ncbi:lytic transglycosylase domain-containing protein [Arthrobacter sp. TWP1-1]|uniref:aggregation-promoting factor C-terminal-like domain-containing protein n=1 Tax=Arthrobacter sp. TWP1-1 TaxID=2804568 RepID=UPI003CEFBC65